MRKRVGSVLVGSDIYIEVFVTDDGNAGAIIRPYNSGKPVAVEIGVAKSWLCTFVSLIHELSEFAYITMGLTLVPDGWWGQQSAERVFYMSHKEFSEANTRVADALDHITPKVKKAWREFHKPKKAKKRRKKK